MFLLSGCLIVCVYIYFLCEWFSVCLSVHKHSRIKMADANPFMCTSDIMSVFYVGVFGCLCVCTGAVPAVGSLLEDCS